MNNKFDISELAPSNIGQMLNSRPKYECLGCGEEFDKPKNIYFGDEYESVCPECKSVNFEEIDYERRAIEANGEDIKK